jgi:hypothetical protein
MTSTSQKQDADYYVKHLNGKLVSKIFWPDSADEIGRYIESNETIDLVLFRDEHGDHAVTYVIEFHSREMYAMHNLRYLESVVYA